MENERFREITLIRPTKTQEWQESYKSYSVGGESEWVFKMKTLSNHIWEDFTMF